MLKNLNKCDNAVFVEHMIHVHKFLKNIPSW